MSKQDNGPAQEVLHSKIWFEESEENNPFAAAKCYCAGYDVYGELLQKASWAEYLYLLFKQERPAKWQAQLLEKIGIAIANPGIRSHSVRAAMCAGVGGSTSASALMAALAVGAGKLEGAHDVFHMMEWWQECGEDFDKWRTMIAAPPKSIRAEIWGNIEHVPGFDPHGASCATPVIQALREFEGINASLKLSWLLENRDRLENLAQLPLAMSGVIATAFSDLEFTPDQGEMLFLLMRLPGAAVHALEQKEFGWRKYPFFSDSIKLVDRQNNS